MFFNMRSKRRIKTCNKMSFLFAHICVDGIHVNVQLKVDNSLP